MKFHFWVLVFVSLCFSSYSERHQCLENPPKLNASSGAGSVGKIGGLKTYINGPDDSRRGIILVSDVYGYEAPNLRKVADKVAEAGFYVLVPDFFHGDPYVANNSKVTLPAWKEKHTPEKGFKDAKQLLASLKHKGITSIGAAGFCWGGKVIVDLAKTGKIQAAVLLHPSNVTLDDIKDVVDPIAILTGELDKSLPATLLREFEDALSSKHQVRRKYYVKIFPGMKHGWTTRYNETDEAAVKGAYEAHQDTLDWFTKYVK